MTPRTRRIREKIATMSRLNADEVLTIEDIAAALDVAAVTIRAYKHRGQMPAPAGTLGRTPYWKKSEITEWIEGVKRRREQTPAPAPSTSPAG